MPPAGGLSPPRKGVTRFSYAQGPAGARLGFRPAPSCASFPWRLLLSPPAPSHRGRADQPPSALSRKQIEMGDNVLEGKVLEQVKRAKQLQGRNFDFHGEFICIPVRDRGVP